MTIGTRAGLLVRELNRSRRGDLRRRWKNSQYSEIMEVHVFTSSVNIGRRLTPYSLSTIKRPEVACGTQRLYSILYLQ